MTNLSIILFVLSIVTAFYSDIIKFFNLPQTFGKPNLKKTNPRKFDKVSALSNPISIKPVSNKPPPNKPIVKNIVSRIHLPSINLKDYYKLGRF